MIVDPVESFMSWLAVYGAVGLFAIGLAERFVPALPSHGVLVAIGIAVVDGAWSLPAAVIATTGGSFGGCFVLYLLGRSVGQSRSARLLYGGSRILGLSRVRTEKTVASFRARERTLIFISQLIPAVRLGAPLIAALIQADYRRFAVGTAIGIALWNSLFITVGYAAILAVPWMNSSVLALKVLVLLVTIQALFVLTWRGAIRCRERLSAPKL